MGEILVYVRGVAKPCQEHDRFGPFPPQSNNSSSTPGSRCNKSYIGSNELMGLGRLYLLISNRTSSTLHTNFINFNNEKAVVKNFISDE